MIVIKATQSKLLAILRSVSGIVERRHTLPILERVMLRGRGRATAASFRRVMDDTLMRSFSSFVVPQRSCSAVMQGSESRLNGFFSSGKANLRNAP